MVAAAAMETALAPFLRAYREPFAEARAHKAGGGAVVGYLTANAPVELIEAAGAFALRIDGGGVADTPAADAFVERLLDPTVRGACELLLRGDLDFLNALVFPRTTDSVQRLYYYLCEQERTKAAKPPRLLFYDLLHTPWYSSAEHSLRSLERLRDALREIGGGHVRDDALANAIAVSNRRRAALSTCLQARRTQPTGLSGVEAHYLFAAARRLSPAAFIAAASALSTAVKGRRAGGGPRLVLAGNAPDTDNVHKILEQAGAVVVGDFHDRGELSMGPAIDVGLPPMRAISDHYHRHSSSPRSFPSQPDQIVGFAREVGADGVLFFYYAEEEVLAWDYPGQRDQLEKAGIASACLAGQPYQVQAERLAAAVAPFVARLKEAVA